MQPNTDFSKNSIHLGAYSQSAQDLVTIEERKTHVDNKPNGFSRHSFFAYPSPPKPQQPKGCLRSGLKSNGPKTYAKVLP